MCTTSRQQLYTTVRINITTVYHTNSRCKRKINLVAKIALYGRIYLVFYFNEKERTEKYRHHEPVQGRQSLGSFFILFFRDEVHAVKKRRSMSQL